MTNRPRHVGRHEQPAKETPMRKIVSQSLVRHVRDEFPAFSDGTYHRVFLWDEGHGYPDRSGNLVPLDQIPRPFCLVQVTGNQSESITFQTAVHTVEDAYDALIHVFCRKPEDSPYEFETLPESMKHHFAGRDIQFWDFDQSPDVLVATAGADRVVVTGSEGSGLADPLFSYRSTLRLQYVFFREK